MVEAGDRVVLRRGLQLRFGKLELGLRVLDRLRGNELLGQQVLQPPGLLAQRVDLGTRQLRLALRFGALDSTLLSMLTSTWPWRMASPRRACTRSRMPTTGLRISTVWAGSIMQS